MQGYRGDGETLSVLAQSHHGHIVIGARGESIHVRDGKDFTPNENDTHGDNRDHESRVTRSLGNPAEHPDVQLGKGR